RSSAHFRTLASLSPHPPPRHLPASPTRRSSDLPAAHGALGGTHLRGHGVQGAVVHGAVQVAEQDHVLQRLAGDGLAQRVGAPVANRKSTRLNSSHVKSSYAVFCLKKKNRQKQTS